jgi:glycosyltransferase involved in cell wall biosynthesis
MRVLWLSINSSCYSSKLSTAHNGGGWVSSLEKIMKTIPEIKLGIAFELKSDKFKDTIDGVDYYPMNTEVKWSKQRNEFSIYHQEKNLIPKCLEVIADFKPDIIQCFGSEWAFGLVANHTDIPVVIHMQGSMPSYNNVLYPPRYSRWSAIAYNIKSFKIKDVVRAIFAPKLNRQRAEREKRVLAANKYFLGRTDWDKSIVNLFSPKSQYFTCNEALRDSFVESKKKWEVKNSETITICTTGSGSLWKGLDVILKTAQALKTHTDLKFRWKIIGGVNNRKYIEWMEGLSFSQNDVEFLGILDEQQLQRELIKCDMYVHPAYIDNSPNSLCEAMLLGVPCIASCVGGISSIIDDGKSGILVPVNEPYLLADKIKQLARDKDMQQSLSNEAIAKATKRHDTKNIKFELLNAYNTILNQK